MATAACSLYSCMSGGVSLPMFHSVELFLRFIHAVAWIQCHKVHSFSKLRTILVCKPYFVYPFFSWWSFGVGSRLPKAIYFVFDKRKQASVTQRENVQVSALFQDLYNHNVTSNFFFPDLDMLVMVQSISYWKAISSAATSLRRGRKCSLCWKRNTR